MCFKSSLLCAAAHAHGVGTIGPVEYLALRHKINNDAAFVTSAQELAVEQINHFGFSAPTVESSSPSGPVSANNWAGLEAFLQFLIPLLMSLFNPPKP